MKVENAIIMAAGTSSRFAPLSYERHKAMTVVNGEVLIERQIEQLKEAHIPDIYIVTGYKAEQFEYLSDKYGVKLIYNSEFHTRNNNSSIWAARKLLGNTYICSSDNYFSINPFENNVEESYYAAEFANGYTEEWCMSADEDGYIEKVTIGGEKSWYMLGHTFWSEDFSHKYLAILEKEYLLPETANKLWEKIFIEHLDILKMRIRKYEPGVIYEFDTLDELRRFDTSYINDTRSMIIKRIANSIEAEENRIKNVEAIKNSSLEAEGFEFDCDNVHYIYNYSTEELIKVS